MFTKTEITMIFHGTDVLTLIIVAVVICWLVAVTILAAVLYICKQSTRIQNLSLCCRNRNKDMEVVLQTGTCGVETDVMFNTTCLRDDSESQSQCTSDVSTSSSSQEECTSFLDNEMMTEENLIVRSIEAAEDLEEQESVESFSVSGGELTGEVVQKHPNLADSVKSSTENENVQKSADYISMDKFTNFPRCRAFRGSPSEMYITNSSLPVARSSPFVLQMGLENEWALLAGDVKARTLGPGSAYKVVTGDEVVPTINICTAKKVFQSDSSLKSSSDEDLFIDAWWRSSASALKEDLKIRDSTFKGSSLTNSLYANMKTQASPPPSISISMRNVFRSVPTRDYLSYEIDSPYLSVWCPPNKPQDLQLTTELHPAPSPCSTKSGYVNFRGTL